MSNLFERIRLLSGLLMGTVAYNAPFYATFDLTRRCNLKCPGCLRHSALHDEPYFDDGATKDIPFELAKTIIENLKSMGTTLLTLTGEGEPLLHPNFFEIVSLAKKNGFHVTLLTNGILIDDAIARSMVDSGLDAVRVTLWTSSRGEYEKNYPEDNSSNFDKVTRGIKTVVDMKKKLNRDAPVIELHHPISKRNVAKIEVVVYLAHETGCDCISFGPFKTFKALDKKVADLTLSSDEIRDLQLTLKRAKKLANSLSLENKIEDTITQYKIGENVWKKILCYTAWVHTHINVDGSVYPCNLCFRPLGNINENSFSEIWNNEPYQSFRANSRDRERFLELEQDCDCSFCCHANNNYNVHSIFKWFAPFAVKSFWRKR